jgi:hypothetical protein
VNPIQLHRLTPGGQPVLYSGLALPTRSVVADQATFEALWRQAFGDATGGGVAPPAVNWARDKVVVVALGERPSGGHAITVTSAKRFEDELLIEVETQLPGNCPSAAVMTQPLDIVSIPRNEPNVIIRFVERERTASCP